MPKRQPCIERGCERPPHGRARRCIWHALDREPIDDQVAEAMRRLSEVPEHLRRARVSEKDWPAGERWCASCQSFAPLWYCQGSRCRACASLASHSASVLKTYGITAMEYRRILELQGGACAICRQKPKSRRLAVDHDHATGAVRGLLHGPCNHELLGAARENPRILRAAAHYLEHPPTSGEWTPPEQWGGDEPPRAPLAGASGDDGQADPDGLETLGEPAPAPEAGDSGPVPLGKRLAAAGVTPWELSVMLRADLDEAPF